MMTPLPCHKKRSACLARSKALRERKEKPLLVVVSPSIFSEYHEP